MTWTTSRLPQPGHALLTTVDAEDVPLAARPRTPMLPQSISLSDILTAPRPRHFEDVFANRTRIASPSSPTRLQERECGSSEAAGGFAHPQKENAGVLQLRPDSNGLLLRACLDRAADVWILHGQSSTILPFDQPSSATRNLHDHEVDKKQFHDTATRCHANGIRFSSRGLRRPRGRMGSVRQDLGILSGSTPERHSTPHA